MIKTFNEAEAQERIDNSSPEELEVIQKGLLATLAGSEFSVEGFVAFFKVVYRFDVYPDLEEALHELFKSTRVVIEAFIESAKTTTITEAFLAFYIGHHPNTSNMLVQVSDDKAEETAEKIANLIMYNEDWKLVFPHIEPAQKPWGKDTGYQVKATQKKEIREVEGEEDVVVWTDISDAEWHSMVVQRRDPTFIGYGYRNSAIQGKRVDGLLVIDDIHDDKNSFSDRELQGTLRKLKAIIMTRAKREAWRIFIGTPWVEGDTLDYAKNLKKYTHVFIPVYVPAKEDTPGAIYWNEIGEWVLTAREEYDADYLDERLDELKEADFARMLQLDLTKVGDRVFYFQEFDSDNVQTHWPTAGGVDFANIMKVSQKNDPSRSFFAQAYVAKNPKGGAIVTGGIRGRFTPIDAEKYMLRAQKTHDNWLGNYVEQDGKGEIFIFYTQQRHPELMIIPMKTHGKGKEARLERGMSPWFANGTVKVSDADDPFLNALRKEMHDYPHGRHRDCLDAVYWALRAMPDVLVMAKEDGLPSPIRSNKKKESVYNEFSKMIP